jgi:hypothetical protein
MPRKPVCTKASHEALTRDPAAWAKLKFVGIQHLPAWGDEPAYALELRNCQCGSTLSIRVDELATVRGAA